MGTGVPALEVFCVPLKAKDILGSCSLENSGNLGKGKSISLTPESTRPAPIPNEALAKNPISPNAVAPAATPFAVKEPKVKGEKANAPAIKAALKVLFLHHRQHLV